MSGLHGIVAAKTYLEVKPSVNLVILEADPSLGGTWARHRIYPGLKTNNVLGSYEMTDLPMKDVDNDLKRGQHIPGNTVTNYMQAYADKFDLNKHFRFNQKVSVIERLDGQWRVTTQDTNFLADKVIVASGMTSQPFVPAILGSETFNVPLIHARDMSAYAEPLSKSPTSVTVYGGHKSAQDAVYYFASNGVKVNWVMRDSGHGPGMLGSTKPVIPGTEYDQIPMMRVMSWLSPCIWGDSDGYRGLRWLLHRTQLGSWMVHRLWNGFSNKLDAENKYDSHPKLRKLKPRYRQVLHDSHDKENVN